MERKYRKLQGILAAMGLMVLILDSQLALNGARTGIELCIRTVIPALFPFFVLSSVLTGSLAGSSPSSGRGFFNKLGIPAAASSVLIPAVLGGYPVGAKCVGDLYQSRQISKREAEQLLTFCSNAGPSFIFGMVSGFFPEHKMVWLLWLIHLYCAFLTAVIFADSDEEGNLSKAKKGAGQQTILLSSARTMVQVCCWVILFRILISFLKDWLLWAFPVWLQVLVMGCLELTNGCCELLQIAETSQRFVLCSGMLALGGVCVLFQTVSVIGGLSIISYTKGKLLQTVFSLIISSAVVTGNGPVVTVVLSLILVFFRKIRNRYSNLRLISV